MVDYDRAISLDPNLADNYNNRGIIKVKLENYNGAFADFNLAIELSPNYAEPYCNRGLLKVTMLADYESAIMDYDRAIELNRNFAEAYLSRGQLLYLNANSRVEAISDVRCAAEISKQQGNLETYQSAVDWLVKWQGVEQPWHQKLIDWIRRSPKADF